MGKGEEERMRFRLSRVTLLNNITIISWNYRFSCCCSNIRIFWQNSRCCSCLYSWSTVPGELHHNWELIRTTERPWIVHSNLICSSSCKFKWNKFASLKLKIQHAFFFTSRIIFREILKIAIIQKYTMIIYHNRILRHNNSLAHEVFFNT